ncbi:MAG: hypothetical protein CMH44_15995 [Muricauda sp.]|nr:hypothetical protein [Allomuricauda sp.]|tara:strand:- start:197 stop:424 length:228 start_codon:yes stop_codon:yes gene_type:complete
MKYNRYKIEDINIGDEVYFDDAYSGKILTQSNFDEYWTVHGINNDQLLVNLREEHYWSLDVSEVRQYIKKLKNDT